MKIYSIILLLLCLLSLFILPSMAIHEDEQGLRDWILRFVGHVEQATFPPGLHSNQIYVTSTQGAVAALSLQNGDLLWRKLFSEPQACITSLKRHVVISSSLGIVHIMDNVDGSINADFQLLLPEGANVMNCATSGENVRVVAVGNSKAYIFEFEVSSGEIELEPKNEFNIGENVEGIRIGGNHLWVLRGSIADRYSLTGTKEIMGLTIDRNDFSVASSGEAIGISSEKFTLIQNEGKKEEIKCSNCEAVVLVNSKGIFKGYVTAKLSKESDGFTLNFPKSKVNIKNNISNVATSTPVILLAIRDEQNGNRVILRSSNSHIIAVSEKEGLIWERSEGLTEITASIIVDNPLQEDHFSFTKLGLGVSKYGVVYIIPVSDMGHNIRVLADVSKIILQNTGASSIKSVKIEKLIQFETNIISVIASYNNIQVTIPINIITGSIGEVKKSEDSLFSVPKFDVTTSLEVRGNPPSHDSYIFTLNKSSGLIEGYLIPSSTSTSSTSSSSKAIPLWNVRISHPIIAYATGEDPLRTSVINHLRIFPNKSSSTDEVRRKYPTRNVLVISYYEPVEGEATTLVITAIDTITGSILAMVRHRNVEGPVHMLIVEHTVLYYFMDAKKMRHCLGVWEMFEEESGPVMRKDAGATLPQVIASFFIRSKKTFSSRASRPPVVTAAVLGVHGGPLAAMGVTTSASSIARKGVVLAFASGRIAAVELSRLLAGGQHPLEPSQAGVTAGEQITHVIIPSTALATHKYRVAHPTLVATEPTNLESSCHVLVSGLDLFYVRASSGKAFDLLNSDFNKSLLVTLTCCFGVLSLVARYFVMRKGLNLMWK